MEINDLRQLSGDLRRTLLAKHGLQLRHGVALDLIAALAGLRNWPEVQAMPEQVASAALDSRAAQRLAHRIKQQFDLEIPAQWLLTHFNIVPVARCGTEPTAVWPRGPGPGVYISTRQELTESFMVAYQQATEGLPAYSVLNSVKWPHGMRFERLDSLEDSEVGELPTGTMVVTDSVSLCQNGWANLLHELRLACEAVTARGLRIVLTTYTDEPLTALHDVRIAAGMNESHSLAHHIRGELAGGDAIQTEHCQGATAIEAPPVDDGRTGFFSPVPYLEEALSQLTSGLVLVTHRDPRDAAIRDIAAMTQSAGPAAVAADCLMTRHPIVGTDPTLLLHQLPLCSSVQVAEARGFKRVFVGLPCGSFNEVLEQSKNMLVIGYMSADTVDKAIEQVAECSRFSPALLEDQLRAVVTTEACLPSMTHGDELSSFAGLCEAHAGHRRFIERLHESVDELPEPSGNYTIESPPGTTFGEKEVAMLLGQISQAMSRYYLSKDSGSASDVSQ